MAGRGGGGGCHQEYAAWYFQVYECVRLLRSKFSSRGSGGFGSPRVGLGLKGAGTKTSERWAACLATPNSWGGCILRGESGTTRLYLTALLDHHPHPSHFLPAPICDSTFQVPPSPTTPCFHVPSCPHLLVTPHVRITGWHPTACFAAACFLLLSNCAVAMLCLIDPKGQAKHVVVLSYCHLKRRDEDPPVLFQRTQFNDYLKDRSKITTYGIRAKGYDKTPRRDPSQRTL